MQNLPKSGKNVVAADFYEIEQILSFYAQPWRLKVFSVLFNSLTYGQFLNVSCFLLLRLYLLRGCLFGVLIYITSNLSLTTRLSSALLGTLIFRALNALSYITLETCLKTFLQQYLVIHLQEMELIIERKQKQSW